MSLCAPGLIGVGLVMDLLFTECMGSVLGVIGTGGMLSWARGEGEAPDPLQFSVSPFCAQPSYKTAWSGSSPCPSSTGVDDASTAGEQ